MVVLRAMRAHKRLPLCRRTNAYVITTGQHGTLIGWFPIYAVHGLIERGMIEDGYLTDRGEMEVERHWK